MNFNSTLPDGVGGPFAGGSMIPGPLVLQLA
jgi:hypothetical protein